MPNFIVNKEDGIYHILFETSYGNRIPYDDKISPSDYPFRIINTDYGKTFIGVNANTLYLQKILTNLNLFPKKERIDYNYIRNVLSKKIEDLVKQVPLVAKSLEYWVIIIQEGRAYELFSDGYIKEDDTLVSIEGLATHYEGNYPLYKEHGLGFLIKTFETYDLNYNDSLFPAVYINTKTFKPKVIGRKKV